MAYNPPNAKKVQFEKKQRESALRQAEIAEALKHQHSREVRDSYREYSPPQIRLAGAMIHGTATRGK